MRRIAEATSAEEAPTVEPQKRTFSDTERSEYKPL
jgi:hypothetical protein